MRRNSCLGRINFSLDSDIIMSPLCTERWGHVDLPLAALSVSPIHFCSGLYILQAVKHKTLTQCWANVGPPPTTLSQYWVTLSFLPPRWMWASVTDGRPTLTQLWFKAKTCRYRHRQHEVPYWLGLNGYWPAPATLAQHLTDIVSVSACTRRQQYALPDPQPRKHNVLNQCWFDAGPASQTVGQNWTSIGSTSRVCWECWQATLCFAHRRVWRY